MLKEPLFFSIFFLLFIGLSDYGYGCHRPGKNDQKGCDDSGTATPVKVTFDDNVVIPDSIQSDLKTGRGTSPYINEEGVRAVIPVEGSPPGQFHMNIQRGGGRSLFIDFGPAVSCATGITDPDGDCVEDAGGSFVECPFPQDLAVRADQDGTPNEAVCSALVKASLVERTAFDLDANGEMVNSEYILDMNPDPDSDQNTPPPVKLVRPSGDGEIGFGVPRPRGNQLTGWGITFSAQDGNCGVPPGAFPDFLSIRALDTDPNSVPNVGGIFGADTWNIGTFNANGFDEPRLACLIKQKGDEFVGFFRMSFMYTIEIK